MRINKMLPLTLVGVMCLAAFSGCASANGNQDGSASASATETETQDSLNSLKEGMVIPYENITDYNGGQDLVNVLTQLGADDVAEFTCDSIEDDHYNLKFTSKGISLIAVLHDHPDDSTVDYHIYRIDRDDADGWTSYYVKDECMDYEPLLFNELDSFPDGSYIKFYGDYARNGEYFKHHYDDPDMDQTDSESACLVESIYLAEEYDNQEELNSYIGSEYTLTGYYNGMDYKALKDRNPVSISVEFECGGNGYYVVCNFDNDKWRNKLDKIQVGELITFKGTCENGYTWNNCSLVE